MCIPKKISRIVAISIWLLFFESLNVSAVVVNGRPVNDTLCLSAAPITLIGESPAGASFVWITPDVNTITIYGGEFTFDPSIAGVGLHTITYNSESSGGGNQLTFTIEVVASSTTLDPFDDVCISDAVFALSGGNPAGGTYSGTGVNVSGNFDPAVAGAGIHSITYTTTNGCAANQDLEVVNLPVVTLVPFTPVCEDDAVFSLTGGIPAGGTYSGTGVTGGTFDPSVSGSGSFLITYTASNSACTSSDNEILTVQNLPAVSISNLNSAYCEGDAAVIITGNPTDANGSFSGNGITDNNDGTAEFDPAIAGAGAHTISYFYDNGTCNDSYSAVVEIGTELTLTGLAAEYCEDADIVEIIGSPTGGTFTVFPGLDDNGDGTAVLDPSVAGNGSYTVEYEYTNSIGCVSTVSKSVAIYPLPTPGFVGLKAGYCTNGSVNLLTGNYAPAGTFSGDGISDNGDGTAVFDPALLAVGGPYQVTYTYANANGCSATATKQTTINPLPTAQLSGDNTICFGDATPLQVDFTGTPPYNFSYSNGSATTNVTGHNSATYNTNVSPADTVIYTMLSVTDANNCTNTGTGSATIEINPEVTINTHPTNKAVCEGANTSFAVTASGLNLTYQWEKDGIPIPGATNPVLTINNVVPADEADYACIVSSSCGGPLQSNTATLSLYEDVTIVTHPQDDLLCSGEELNLSVTATGSNVTYQWRKDGVDIPGANLAVYTLTGVTTANIGTYTCYVDGSCNPTESNPAEITIDSPVTITSQPTNKVACTGSNTSFSVTATGTSLTYQWKKSDGTIMGNSQSLIFNNVAAGEAGSYYCIVTSPCGATRTSNSVTLTVTTSPAITAHPIDAAQCEGDNINFTVSATGSNLNYTWQKDESDLADTGNVTGSATDQLILNALLPYYAGDYRCVVTNSCGSATSDIAVLTVDNNISISKQPTDKTICDGSSATITVEANGSNLTYQWYHNAVPMPGETDPELDIANADATTHDGNYYCEISNGCGQVISSNVVTVIVHPLLNITVHPLDFIKCAGEEVTFKVNATGSNLTYTWYKDNSPIVNGGNISGASTRTLVITNLLITDEGTYHCRVSSVCGTENSDPAGLVVDDNITITEEPKDTVVCPGANLVFSVEATGSNLTYSWQKDGVGMGITDPVLTLNGVDASDEAIYRCVITNSCGNSLMSQPAELSLLTPTSIVTQPSSATVCEGGGVSFTISASGSDIAYQWRKDGVALANSSNVSGVSTSTLNITSAQLADNGSYTCAVTGICGEVNSSGAVLKVEKTTLVTSHPSNKTVCSGNNISFSVTATGTNMSYQWQLNGVNILGEQNSTLQISGVNGADAGVYRCIVTGNCGTTNSNGALLTVYEPTVITAQPSGDIICENEQALFTLAATGEDLTYQWLYNGSPVTDNGIITGSNTPVLSIDPAGSGNTGIYECRVSGACGNLLSEEANLLVNEVVSISKQPVNKAVCPGDNTVFSVEASGSGLNYDWQKNGVSTGITTSSIILTNIDGTDAAGYKCIVSNACGSKVSQVALLTVLDPVTIITQPTWNTICEGESAGMSVDATGSGLTYQWKLNTTPLTDNGTITGTATNTLSINPASMADGGTYNCEVTGVCGSQNSVPAQLKVQEQVSINLQPVNLVACENDDAVFSVSASGSDLSYQWQKEGADIAGATGSEFIINGVTETDEATYRCVVSGACGTQFSDGASLTINQAVSITTQPAASTAICEGNNLNLSISATGSNLTYQWRKGGTALVNGGKVSGALSSNLFITNVDQLDDGVYTCEVQSSCNVGVSSLADVLVKDITVITQQPVDYYVAEGQNASFSVTAKGYGLSYTWQKDGANLVDGGNISGVSAANLSISNVAETDEGFYSCIVRGDCDTVNSAPADLVVNPTTIITSQPSGLAKCVGESASFSVATSVSSPTYQWKLDGTDITDGTRISGSQTANLNINSLEASDAGAYTCVINGDVSIPAILTVNEPVTISTQPVSRQSCEGNDLSFSVTASGSGLSYQWQLNSTDLIDGGNLSGSLTNTLIISSATVLDEGTYQCVITGICGTNSSDPATLNVIKSLSITTQPTGDTICEGNAESFTVLAEGEDLTYTWKKSGIALTDGGNISGASTDNLSINPVSSSDAGSYYCTVSDIHNCRSDNTDIATLKVRRSTQITFHPTDLDACQGDEVSFAVSAEGDQLSYQWQKDGIDMANSARISGVTTNYLVIDNISAADAGAYRCYVMATCDSFFSDAASLSVFDDPVITSHPQNKTVCYDSPASFSVVATGTALTYQWLKNGSPVSNNSNISGSSTSTLSFQSATATDAGTYTCIVSGNCAIKSSNLATLTLKTPVTITNQPAAFSGCEGEDISLVVSATGSNLSYQWQKDNVNVIDGPGITGSTTNNLKISAGSIADMGAYHCIVSGYCGSVNSNPATVTIFTNTVIQQHPVSDTVCEGVSMSLNVTAKGENLSYQWLKEGNPIQDTGYFAGVQQDALIIGQSEASYEGNYSVEVAGGCGTVTSFSAKAVIMDYTIINRHPVSKEKCSGDFVIFSVEASGENITYTWQKDGVDLVDGGKVAGANTNTVTINNLSTDDQGNYRCIVSGDCNMVNSNEARLTVTAFPGAAGSIIGETQVCQEASGVLYEIPAISNADYYVWELPTGVGITSGDSTRAVVVDFGPGEAGGDIIVRGVNGCGAGTPSTPVKVTANSSPDLSAGADIYVCKSDTSLLADNPGMANGSWSVVSGPATIADQALHNTAVSGLRTGENVFVWTVELNGCVSTDTVIVYNNSVSASAGVDVATCSGNVTLEGNNVPAGATGTWSVVSGLASFEDANLPASNASDFATGQNLLKWTITRAGCSDSDTVIINNQTPTTAYAGINKLVCADSTVMQGNAPIVGTGTWTLIKGAAVIENPASYNSKITGIKKGDNILRWTITNGICESIDEVTITNNQIEVEAGEDQIICDRSTDLAADVPSLGTGTWSVTEGSAVFVNSNDATTKVTSLSPGGNVLKWVVENNGCLSSDTVRITNDSPSTAYAGMDQEVDADSTVLAAEDPTIGTGQWIVLSGSADIEDPLLHNSKVTGLGPGENTLRWIVSHNSCISSDDVIINYLYVAETDAGPDQVLCSDKTTLEGNEPVFGFGQWSVVKGSAVFADNSDPKTAVTNLAKGENILRWTIWENDYKSDDVIITNNLPTTPYAGADRVICADSLTLSANSPVTGNGYWTIVAGSAEFEDSTLYNTNARNLSKGINTFKWTIENNGCDLSDLVTIVNDQPSAAVAGEDQILCVDSTLLFPESPSIGTGEWGVVSGSAIFDGNKVSALASGTNILRWTVTNNSCKDTDEVTIINNMPTKARAGSDKVICVDSVSMFANEPVVGTGQWTILNGSATFDDMMLPNAELTNVALGTNVFRWTIEHEGCLSADETEIKYLFEQADAGDDQVLCSNETSLNAQAPSLATGYWSLVGGSGARFENSAQPDTRVTGLDYGKNTLRWTVQNDVCVSVDEVVITNNLPNEAYAGPDQSICGTSLTLNAGEPAIGTGTWSILGGSGTFADSSLANTEITGLGFGSNTLRWTVINEGCILSNDVVIFNNSVSTSIAGEDQIVCYDSAQLNANLPVYGSGEWLIVKGGAIFEDQQRQNTKISHLAQGENILTWRISNGQCESESNVTIINNTPTQSIAGSDQDVCGKEVTLNANDPEIGTGQWKLISGGGEITTITSNNTTITGLNPGANVFRWTVTREACISYDEVTINNNVPFDANAGTDMTICGSETRLYANNPGDATGTWSIVSGDAIFSDLASNNPDLYEIGFGSNTFEWKIDFGECTSSDVVTVINNMTTVNAGADQIVNTSHTTLVASNPTSGTGTWSVIGGAGTFEDPNSLITKVTNIGSGKNTYRWSVDVEGCLSTDEVYVTYNVPAEASFVADIYEGCPPLEVYFVNNSLSNLPFVWDFGDGTGSEDVSVMHTFKDAGFYNVSLTVYGDKGEVITKDTTIHVYDEPVADFVLSAEEIYIPEEEAIFINRSQNTVSYLWDFGDGQSSTDYEPFHTYEEEGVYDVTLIGWTNMDCSDTLMVEDAVSVVDRGILEFPNAFTPSRLGPGDGVYGENDYSNDVFHPHGEGVVDYHLEIFNKWGMLLFESFDINIGWDGYYKEKLVSEGAYVWKVSGTFNNGKRFVETGTVLVLH